MFRTYLTAILIVACEVAAADLLSSFDSDLDGWTTDNTGTLQHMGAGGNPDGFLHLDNDELGIAHLFAPGKFLGDLSSFDGGTIQFDGNLLGSGGSFFDGADDYGLIEITGTSGTASLDLLPGGATPPANAWQTYSATLDSATWGVSQSDWAAILSDVTSVRLTVEGLFGNEIQGIDNVRMSAVPEPSALLLLGLVACSGAVYHRSRILPYFKRR